EDGSCSLFWREAPAWGCTRGWWFAEEVGAQRGPVWCALEEGDAEEGFSQQMGRFLGCSELTSCILSEQELAGVEGFWDQALATLQVAAESDAGRSSWSVVRVALSAGASPASAAAGPLFRGAGADADGELT
ncbi:unnamed protein product, partial [Prorocentrum cordatum]